MQIEVTMRLTTCYYCLYGIDAGRKTAFDDRVQVIRRGCNPGLVVEFAAQRVDLIATDFYESGVLPAAIFHPSPNGVVSEYVMLREVGLNLPVLRWASATVRCFAGVYVASICLFLHGWFGWVLGDESVMSISSIQACSAFRHDVAPVCTRFLPGNRTYKEVIRPSDKTEWRWKKKIRETIGRLLSTFRCRCFPNERKLHPCYTSHFLTVPFASLLFPIALTAFCVQLRLPPKTVKPKYQPEN